MRANGLVAALLICLACLGCGRKLPPLPPGPEDPAVLKTLDFDHEAVVAKVVCNMEEAKLTLLGKPQGLCPQCTDDLKKKQEIAAQPGVNELRDPAPEERCMVYRVRLEKGTTSFLSPARIVCK